MTAAASQTTPATKDLYALGEIPPLGHVPATMWAWAIRKDRHGPPETDRVADFGRDHLETEDGGERIRQQGRRYQGHDRRR